jgi:hypothetical protein
MDMAGLVHLFDQRHKARIGLGCLNRGQLPLFLLLFCRNSAVSTVAVAGLRLACVCHRGPEEAILISQRLLRRKIRFL